MPLVPPNVTKISLRQYMENPTGKGTAFVAKRALIRQGMTQTFIYLLRNYRKAFYAIPYILDNGNLLYHVKVPSEEYKDNHISYDVFFELEKNDLRRRAQQDIKMFSNCPSFIFSYCYVYNTKGLIIDRLKSHLPSEALTQPPKVRNPEMQMGFEKSTWIAACYLIQGGCLTDLYISKFGQKLHAAEEARVFSGIADFNTIMAVYQKAAWEARKSHRKERNRATRERQQEAVDRYKKHQRENKVKGVGFLRRAPRSVITAKKAQKPIKNKKVP